MRGMQECGCSNSAHILCPWAENDIMAGEMADRGEFRYNPRSAGNIGGGLMKLTTLISHHYGSGSKGANLFFQTEQGVDGEGRFDVGSINVEGMVCGIIKNIRAPINLAISDVWGRRAKYVIFRGNVESWDAANAHRIIQYHVHPTMQKCNCVGGTWLFKLQMGNTLGRKFAHREYLRLRPSELRRSIRKTNSRTDAQDKLIHTTIAHSHKRADLSR